MLYVVIACVIWHLLLTGHSMGYTVANVLLHVVVPVLAVVVLNQVGRRAPYYFMDPGSVGVGTVLLNVCVLGCAVIAVGYALLAVNRLATPP